MKYFEYFPSTAQDNGHRIFQQETKIVVWTDGEKPNKNVSICNSIPIAKYLKNPLYGFIVKKLKL